MGVDIWNIMLAGGDGVVVAGTTVFVMLLFHVMSLIGLLGRKRTSCRKKACGNSIRTEKIHVTINGVSQGMFIDIPSSNKDKDGANNNDDYPTKKPVILFLHGGPGMPEHFLTEFYPSGLMVDDFTAVCWWEQRGAGLSYDSRDCQRITLTVEQIIQDAIAVTQYLRRRFRQDKIYLMGHSGGSFFGIQVAARAPELYHAYIGVGQMTYQLESERMAYEYMLNEFQKQGNTKMVRRLKATPPTTTQLEDRTVLPKAYLSLRDTAMHSLGVGTMRDMQSVVTGIFLPSLLSSDYTISEKVSLWRGKMSSMHLLRDTMFATDLTHLVTELDVPVYFLHGKYDYTCSYALAKAYLGKLKAPRRGFYTFEDCAHSPIFEDPERFAMILRNDVLAKSNRLADGGAE